MLKNIVFDMGNVLMRFDPKAFVARIDVKPEERALLLQQIFQTNEWVCLDDGSLIEDEFMIILQERLPLHLHDAARELLFAWDQPLDIISGMEELIGEMKARGYHIYLLSNASARQHEYWERIPAAKYFDGTLISADVRMAKPDPNIFLELFRRFGLVPQESVFIDDSPKNIEASRQLGMDGYLFSGDADSLRQWLKEKYDY